jgi:hypothetical protein
MSQLSLNVAAHIRRPKNRTRFCRVERCLWHSAGEYALILPIDGFARPPAGAGHAEDPENKRRLCNLPVVTGCRLVRSNGCSVLAQKAARSAVTLRGAPEARTTVALPVRVTSSMVGNSANACRTW